MVSGPAAVLGIADYEETLVSWLLQDSSRIDSVRDLELADFADPRLGVIYQTLRTLADSGGYDFVLVRQELDQGGDLDRAGGAVFLGALCDEDPFVWDPNHYVKRIRREAVHREMRAVHERAAEDPRASDIEELAALQLRLERIDQETRLPIDAYGYRGTALVRERESPDPESPLPELLDPMPTLHVISGKPKSGKTTFVLGLAQAWCCGLPPWDRCRALPGSQVLVISKEQRLRRIDNMLRRMDVGMHRNRDTWTARTLIVPRTLPRQSPGKPLLTLDDAGLHALEGLLAAQAATGDPFGFVVLDSLSRLKPPDVEENDNDGMSRWLDQLQDVAEAQGVYMVVIHHVAKQSGAEVTHAGRGASAIGAVPQALWLLERDKSNPRRRTLRTQGNAIRGSELCFEVCSESVHQDLIDYWHPIEKEDVQTANPEEYLEPGEQITTRELARRIALRELGTDAVVHELPRAILDKATALRAQWQRRDLVEVTPGPRNSKVTRLKKTPNRVQVGQDGEGDGHPIARGEPPYV